MGAWLHFDVLISQVLAEHLELLILFVDMEYARGTSPYRVLASGSHPKWVIILKRHKYAHFTSTPIIHGQYFRLSLTVLH